MDTPLRLAVEAFGGRKPFFRKLGLHPNTKWTRVPRERLFEVAKLTGLAPDHLRPDLDGWIADQAQRQAQASQGVDLLAGSLEARWDEPVIEPGLTDLWSTFAAVIFVARVRGLKIQAVCYGRGGALEEARTYAMALAHVAGRATSIHVANVFRCSRQNVDNASERYLRARDGDDPDDFIQGQFGDGRPRVLELGSNRLRLAKSADPALWAAQAQFEAFLRGEDLAPTPERKRA